MSYAYRCMRCRGRNTLRHALEWYVRAPKCKHCKHDRFYLDKARQYRTDYCSCEGYHYTHRRCSTYCIHRPDYERNVRIGRYGEDPLEVDLDMAFHAPPPISQPNQCPF